MLSVKAVSLPMAWFRLGDSHHPLDHMEAMLTSRGKQDINICNAHCTKSI